jgi:hypothetical protein
MPQQFGPAGGSGGRQFTALPDGPWRIGGVEGRSADRIDQIEVVWTDSAGKPHSSDQFGGQGGKRFGFQVNPGAYLTEIRGSVGTYAGTFSVFSLQFVTSDNVTSRVFGKATGYPFVFACPDGYHIVGLVGRSGHELDALGVYIDRIPTG